MLPKLISDNGNFYKIEPIGFKDFSDFGLDAGRIYQMLDGTDLTIIKEHSDFS